jgi:ribosome biogenesis GTPase A
MAIQWFPGHMTKALREMESEMKNIDVVFYLLDARAPLSCFNPKLSSLAKNKKIIYILNKSDLVDARDIARFTNILQKQNGEVVALNSTQSNSAKILFLSAKKLLKEKLEQKLAKGINYGIKVMVVGVPNVGKSTLINNLCAKAKTQTGDRPGVTKGKQWVTTKEGFLLLDTPGTLWPSFENEKIARNLAYIGSIKDEVVGGDIAFDFLKDILKNYKTFVENRYGITIEDNEEILSVFEKICRARNCFLKNNELDYDRCGRMIIDDFRKGRLGKIVLD